MHMPKDAPAGQRGSKPARSPRNRTICTSVEDGQEYLGRCIQLSEPVESIGSVACTTILGDAFSVLPLLPKGSVDLIVADPPYNLSKTYGSTRFRKTDADEYEAYTRRWMSLAFPLLKPTGSAYVCCDWRSSLIVGRCLQAVLQVESRITWEREKGRGAKSRWKDCLEDVWFAVKSDSHVFNLDAVKVRRKVLAPYRADGKPKDWQESGSVRWRDTCPSNFWDDITVPFWSMPENTAHPTQKPEKLAAKLILASSNPGDIVLDPFLGSGTSSVAAKKLGRRYIGIEREPQYCIWAEQRLEKADACRDIQGYENGVFLDRRFKG